MWSHKQPEVILQDFQLWPLKQQIIIKFGLLVLNLVHYPYLDENVSFAADIIELHKFHAGVLFKKF